MPAHIVALYGHPALVSIVVVALVLMASNIVLARRADTGRCTTATSWTPFAIGAFLNGVFLLVPVSVLALEAGAA